MRIKRLTAISSLFLAASFLFSCSSTSKTVKSNTGASATENAESRYPSWYNSSRSVKSDSTAYFDFATAIASDSVQSSQKAIIQAKAELKSAISEKLEMIRNNAATELGSDSGLNSPGFIAALRNAENIVLDVSKVEEAEVSDVKGRFRSFAKVSADKEDLISEFDKVLSTHSKDWQEMKESKAFVQF